jgi:hypothetical protein
MSVDELGSNLIPRPVLIEPATQIGFQRIGNDLRAVIKCAIQNHIPPIASPVKAIMFVGKQLGDELIAFVRSRVQ